MPGFEFELCPSCLCGAALRDDARTVARDTPWGPIRFRRCDACGSWNQSPQIAAASLGAWFDSEAYRGGRGQTGAVYLDYMADEPARRLEAEGRYRRDLSPWLRSGADVLEIGCATGTLLSVLAAHGHAAMGVDLSAAFASFGRSQYGLDIREGDLLQVDLEDRQFDAVLLFGTIGNLRQPGRYLARIRRLLRPGGALMFNYPAADALVARLYGTRFWMFTPSVSGFMTDQGCHRLLASTGYRVERVRGDRQRPSLGKVSRLAGLPVLQRWRRAACPLSCPVPGVRFVVARPDTNL